MMGVGQPFIADVPIRRTDDERAHCSDEIDINILDPS